MPSFRKVTLLLAGLLFRRFVNRLQAGFGRKRKKSAAGPSLRTGTARKSSGSALGGIAILVIFGFNAVTLSLSIMDGLQNAVGPARDGQGRVEIDARSYDTLLSYREIYPKGIPDSMFRFALTQNHPLAYSTSKEYAGPWVQVYRQRGLAGFVRMDKSQTAWQNAALRPLLLRCLGVVFLVFAAMRYLWSMGSQNQDLGRVEWSTEWLFSMPASAGKLFGAQILGHALVDPFSWIAAIPFMGTLYYRAGLNWWWIGLAAVFNGLCLGAIMASLRVGTETFLRKRLAPARLKNLQALFTVTGICLLFFLIGLGRSPQLLSWVVMAGRAGSDLLIWNPFSLPAGIFALPPALVLAAELAGAGIISLLMIWLCSFLVRDGLIATSGVYLGTRGGGSKAGRDFLPSGIVGKDLRLLLRDRNFCVQTLVAPVLVVGFQIFFNSGMATAISADFHRAATFAFGIGAYVLISTGLTVLSVEGNSLWMLYGLPVPLHRIMLRKTLLWAALAALYAGIALVVCGIHIGGLKAADFSYAAVALVGVVIFAFIASGIGMLSTDPLEVEVKRRIRPGMVYLYMILASLYGYALYAPSVWTRIGEIVLSSLLVYALWQKVKDRAPFLLDTVSAPPPQVSLADGLMAALGFFILQGVFTAGLLVARFRTGEALTIAFTVAGALVVSYTLFSFWKQGVVGLFSTLGMVGPRNGRRGSSAALGIGLGVAGAALATIYLRALDTIPWLREFRDSAHQMENLKGWWLVALAVGAAPLFEEFIFRGLVFRGLRRSLPARWSILASAAVFAVCHPPISVAPVFAMAVLAAWGFEITGWIVTPICVHMTYNALVLLAQAWWRHGP